MGISKPGLSVEKGEMGELRLLIKLVRYALSPRLRLAVLFWLLLLTVSAGMDLVALAALVPFLQIISSAESDKAPGIVIRLADLVGLEFGDGRLLLLFGIAVCCVVISNSLLKLVCLFLSGKITASIGSQIARRIFSSSLYQSYESYTLTHSADLITRVQQTDALVGGVLQPTFQASASLLPMVLLIGGMLSIEPKATIGIISIVAIIFGSANVLAQDRIVTLGRIMTTRGVAINKILQNSSVSFREIKLDSMERLFLNEFVSADQTARWMGQQITLLGAAPRIVIEGGGISALILVSLVLSVGGVGSNAVVTIGFVAYGFQRILPSAQQVYASVSSIRAYSVIIRDIWSNIMKYKKTEAVSLAASSNRSASSLLKSGFKSLEFRDVSYRYPSSKETLGPYSFKIQKGELVGVIGPTGVGKSTLIDLMMGLLRVTGGSILVNGEPLQWNPATDTADKGWLQIVSHVPQSVFLIDASIRDNICLKDRGTVIDEQLLEEAIDCACLRAVIDSLPEGLDTFVGENGIRLSGGQNQRGAIARALYKGGSYLVLDEATSALDQDTEREIMSRLSLIDGLTVISIAHRLVSLRDADRIFRIGRGKQSLVELSPSDIQ